MALIGFVLVLMGMVGTARLFREEYLGPVPEVMKGFVPIAAVGQGGSAPPLANRPHASTRPRVTLVSPEERAARIALLTPSPESSVLPTESLPLASPSAPPADSVTPEGQAALDPTALPEATATPEPEQPAYPEWIDIPVIGLEAPVVDVSAVDVVISGQPLQQWSAPNDFAAGWHASSAMLGQPGNTVLNGHHNVYGSVFANLHKLVAGDQIFLWAEGRVFIFEVDQVMLLEERNASVANRQENARWILPSEDERLTLVTCWPPESNTHRFIVVARRIL